MGPISLTYCGPSGPACLQPMHPSRPGCESSVQLTQPKPLFHIAGIRDSQIPFADQKSAIEIARRVDGVAGEGASCGNGCTVYGANTANPVMTWIHAGGHEYPPSTSERIVKFFREH